MLVFTGQRVGDVRGMNVDDYDGEKIRVSQDKTDVRVWVPIHYKLKALLEAHLENRKKMGRVDGAILQTVGGEPFKKRYFNERWNKIARKVDIDATLQPRDLRRTAITRLYEAGCTMRQVAAISGHSEKSVEKIIETYVVTTYPMARDAMKKYEEYSARQDEE